MLRATRVLFIRIIKPTWRVIKLSLCNMAQMVVTMLPVLAILSVPISFWVGLDEVNVVCFWLVLFIIKPYKNIGVLGVPGTTF